MSIIRAEAIARTASKWPLSRGTSNWSWQEVVGDRQQEHLGIGVHAPPRGLTAVAAREGNQVAFRVLGEKLREPVAGDMAGPSVHLIFSVD